LLAAKILKQGGHCVTEACDGKEGLEKFRANQIDLVLMDVVMPTKEGLETIIELRRDFPDAKIIAMSGAIHSESYLKIAGRLGASRTIDKPFNGDELLSAVNTALGDR
jgi:YesN/AraC family two-component response regulator